jgi:chorismate mutase
LSYSSPNISKLCGDNNKIIIAGPCSAESESQVLTVASQLKHLGVKLFRAGIWKPRTRPGSFEGVGVLGLKWLAKVQNDIGINVCTEVANAKHVNQCLNFGIKYLWIGARTTANPFLVQEISDSLKGKDVHIFVKNPICADIGLWIGAIERLYDSGVSDVAMIHRGFSTFSDISYRNDPQWDKALAMRMRFPSIPFICDPSHIGGKAEYVFDIAQHAMNLGLDGLMIEVHPLPQNALSDSRQQLTIDEFSMLLNRLTIRSSSDSNNEIEFCRNEIDDIDNEILSLLAKRMSISHEIGELKEVNNIPIVQQSRWNQVLLNINVRGEQLGLNHDLINTIYSAIHIASIDTQ